MFRKGVTLLAAGDPGAALLEFQEALTNAVGDAKADSLYNIAVCYVRLGDMDMAMQALVKAVGLDPQLAQEIRLDQDRTLGGDRIFSRDARGCRFRGRQNRRIELIKQ